MLDNDSMAFHEAVRVPFTQLRHKALERARQADKSWDHQLTVWQVGSASLLASPRALCEGFRQLCCHLRSFQDTGSQVLSVHMLRTFPWPH